MKQRISLIAAFALTLGMIFNWFFIDKTAGLSIFIYTSLILGFTFTLGWQFRRTFNNTVFFLIPPILFFAFMVFVRANGFLAFINTVTVMYLLALVSQLAHQPGLKLKKLEVSEYLLLPPRLTGAFARGFGKFFKFVGDNFKFSRKTASWGPTIRGILIAIPILAVFIVLLSSADLVFNNFLSGLVNIKISPDFIPRAIVISFITSLFVGAFTYIFLQPSAPTAAETQEKKRHLGAIEAFIVLGSVASLFMIFVIIQSTYLFGGAGHFAATGLTYADYARKGFFELIAVAAISLFLVGAIRKASKFGNSVQTNAFKWLSIVLVTEVAVIMYSAHMRLNLYETVYGFTTLRLLSHLFILWLVYAFGQLIYHIVRNKPDSSYAFQLFVSALVFWACINVLNPDKFIAKRNIARFNETGKIDTAHITSLSEDATPLVVTLLDSKDKTVRTDVATSLYYQYRRIDRDYDKTWLSANVARRQAQEVVESKSEQIDKYRIK